MKNIISLKDNKTISPLCHYTKYIAIPLFIHNSVDKMQIYPKLLLKFKQCHALHNNDTNHKKWPN